MNVTGKGYDAALEIFKQAVVAFCRGNREEGDRLLATLDLASIHKERENLRRFGMTGRMPKRPPTPIRGSRSIPGAIYRGVRERDRYHCRFTGQRLIETRVFHEVSRVSTTFHFDIHHSVRETHRGPGGHPIVRSHGAAYEHADPHSCGGRTTLENIFHISVELNEYKGIRILPVVDVPADSWDGLTSYLPKLRRLPSADKLMLQEAEKIDRTPRRTTARKGSLASSRSKLEAIRCATQGLDVLVFAYEEDVAAEESFLRLRRREPNARFITERNDGSWSVHRMYCSTVTFHGTHKVTAKPKIFSRDLRPLVSWAKIFSVQTSSCRRCSRPK